MTAGVSSQTLLSPDVYRTQVGIALGSETTPIAIMEVNPSRQYILARDRLQGGTAPWIPSLQALSS